MALVRPKELSRQEFMKALEARSLEKAEVMRLPFIYSPLDEPSVIQSELIRKSRISRLVLEGAN